MPFFGFFSKKTPKIGLLGPLLTPFGPPFFAIWGGQLDPPKRAIFGILGEKGRKTAKNAKNPLKRPSFLPFFQFFTPFFVKNTPFLMDWALNWGPGLPIGPPKRGPKTLVFDPFFRKKR